MYAQLGEAITLVFTFKNLIGASIGITVGFIFGTIPGLTGNVAIGLLVPFTFYLDPLVGIVTLLAIGKGTSFGGSIPAILFNMPGTPQATATAIDGYQLTRNGKAKKALHMALFASVGGDLLSDLTLLAVAPPLAMIALKIGPPEYATIILFSMLIIGAFVGSSPTKGMIAAGFGLLLGTVGRDLFTASERLTFGAPELEDGIPLIPMLLGMLVLSEIFLQLRRRYVFSSETAALETVVQGKEGVTWGELKRAFPTIFRSGALGTFIGAVPGLGATLGAFLSFNVSKKIGKDKENIGKGSLFGVASAEAGNSAGTGANLIPLVTLGIPGNVEAALILGAFMIHGMTPGPFLMEKQGPLVYAIFLSLILANILLISMGFVFIRVARSILNLDRSTLFPLILLLTTVGSYSISRELYDVGLMFVFGLFGYIMRRLGFTPIPTIITFLLGPLFEDGVRWSLRLSGGDPSIFFTRPIALIFILLSVATFVAMFYTARKESVSHR
ncbi:MAG: tripartite tricarboxylate transporter permease [Deltaproteobacteria bacterium]|nr:tripartite tricarboxylate transporter permease [Deltaproteobacteria bacterium]